MHDMSLENKDNFSTYRNLTKLPPAKCRTTDYGLQCDTHKTICFISH